MALQPQDEQNDLQTTHQYINLEPFQFLENITSNPISTFNFSSVTNTVSNLSSNTEDLNRIEDAHSGVLDVEEKLEELMKNVESNFGDMSCDECIDCLTKELDEMELKEIDRSITDRTMSVETQPPTDIRRRYKSDGKRQIEKSRSKPMAIKLPNLENCKLNPNQSFWLQLCLKTTNKNPLKKVFIHPYQLEYHEKDLPICDHGFILVPLTQEDIEKGIKQLARISIIKIKLDEYTFQFTPFHQLPTDNTVEIYENKNAKSLIAKAKCCRDAYNLQSSRIHCNFLIKQNDTWFMTDIECETDIMEEKNSSNKRSISSNISDNDEEEYQIQCQTPAKKPKRSSSVDDGLPVTRIKNS